MRISAFAASARSLPAVCAACAVQRDGLLQIAVGVFLHEAALVQLLCTLRDHADR